MNIYGKLAGKAELTKQASTQNDIPPPSSETQDHEQQTKIPEKEPSTPTITEAQIPLPDSKNTTDPSSNSKSTNEDSHHGTEEKKIHSSDTPIPTPTPITKKPQPCWKNCVIITPCALPQKEPFLPPDTKTDVHQEILLSYVAYKVFENEDESWESFYWRRLLRKPSNNDMGNAKKRMKFSIWEKIEEKEKEVHSRVMNDSQYLENLLSSITSVPEKQDPAPEESSNKEVLEFFPGINMRFQAPFATVKRTQPQENYQGYNLFPKKPAAQSMEYVPSWTIERSQDSSRNGINPFQRISSSSSSHYENKPLDPYYVFNNRHF